MANRTKNTHKKGKSISYELRVFFVSCSAFNIIIMLKPIILGAFYDAMQYNIGWIISYIFIFLMVIELIYVMAKYLGPRK